MFSTESEYARFVIIWHFLDVGSTSILSSLYKLSHTHTHTVGEDYTTAGTNVDLTVSAGDDRSCFSYSLGSRDDHVTIEGALRGEVRIADNDEQAVIIGFEHSEYTVLESESITACVWMTGAQIGQPFTATIYTAHTSTINRGQLRTCNVVVLVIVITSGCSMVIPVYSIGHSLTIY